MMMARNLLTNILTSPLAILLVAILLGVPTTVVDAQTLQPFASTGWTLNTWADKLPNGSKIWDVIQIEMYTSSDCGDESEKIDVSRDVTGYLSTANEYLPDNAFQDNDLVWSGRPKDDGTFFFIGARLRQPVTVRCIRLRQDTQFYTNQVVVRADDKAAGKWIDIHRASVGPGISTFVVPTKMIPSTIAPTTYPATPSPTMIEVVTSAPTEEETSYDSGEVEDWNFYSFSFPKSWTAKGGTNDGTSFPISFTESSGCVVQFVDFPWSVDCTVGLSLGIGSDAINNGGTIDIEASAFATIDAADLLDPEAKMGYAVEILPIEVDLGSISVGTFGNSITLSELDIILNKDLLDVGICLSNFDEDILPSFVQRQGVQLTRESAELVGLDVCASAPGLHFTPDGLGGEVKLALKFSIFDPQLANSETLMNQVLETLGLSGPISFSLDLGELVSSCLLGADCGNIFVDGNRRMLQEAPVTASGTFVFGTAVGANGLNPDDEDSSTSNLAKIFVVIAIVLVLLLGVSSLGIWFFCRRKRANTTV